MNNSNPFSFLSFHSFPLPLFSVFPPKLVQVNWVEKTEMGGRQAEKKAGAATRGTRKRMGGMVCVRRSSLETRDESKKTH